MKFFPVSQMIHGDELLIRIVGHFLPAISFHYLAFGNTFSEQGNHIVFGDCRNPLIDDLNFMTMGQAPVYPNSCCSIQAFDAIAFGFGTLTHNRFKHG